MVLVVIYYYASTQAMAGFFVFSRRPADMGNLIIFGRGAAYFLSRGKEHGRNRKNADSNAAFLAFLPVLRSKTGKKQHGAALEHLK